MNKRIFYILPVLILVVGFIIMQLLAGMKEEPERRVPAMQVKSVRAQVVRIEATPTFVSALGKVTSSNPVQLVSEVSGVLQRGDVRFKPGQRFQKGQVLLRVDDRQVRLSLNSTKSDFMNALAAILPEIKIDFPDSYQIWQSYFDGCGFDSNLKELPGADNRKIKLLLTRGNVYKLYYATRNLEITLDKHAVVAPFSGAVVSTAQREGSTARNGTVLGEIISLQDLELEIPVPASDLEWIDRSKQVLLTSKELSGSWNGRISRIGGSVDQQTQTLPVYITVQGNGNPLYEGMFLEATIPGKPVAAGTVVPRRALYEERFVYIVQDGRLEKRDVNIVRRNPESVVVSGGLQQSDTLVIELLQGVSPGMPAEARITATEDAE